MISCLKDNLDFTQKLSLADYDVQFLGFINKQGRLEDSSSRTQFDLSKQKKEMLFMEFSLQDRMLRDFDEDFGKVRYSMIERNTQKFVAIPLNSGVLFGILPRISNHVSFVNDIKSILSQSKKGKNRKI